MRKAIITITVEEFAQEEGDFWLDLSGDYEHINIPRILRMAADLVEQDEEPIA